VTITPVPGQQLRSGVDDDWEQPGIAMAGAVQYGDWKMLEGQQAHLATEKDMQGLKTPRSCRCQHLTLQSTGTGKVASKNHVGKGLLKIKWYITCCFKTNCAHWQFNIPYYI
jgi:hypothetical protein